VPMVPFRSEADADRADHGDVAGSRYSPEMIIGEGNDEGVFLGCTWAVGFWSLADVEWLAVTSRSLVTMVSDE
jgi:hypothetical protein